MKRDNPGLKPSGVAVTMPGTLESSTRILSSKRLGIWQPIDFSDAIDHLGGLPTRIYHDTECLGLGESLYGTVVGLNVQPDHRDNFCYILVDEGIGSKLFINGRPVEGAGSAGHLGRLIVSPDGAYNEAFASRGPLEVFASRPWVSTSMVGHFHAERGKSGQSGARTQTFRRYLQAASDADWSSLTYKQMSTGIENRDPIATAVLEEAAKYLGLAINAVATIAHPPQIMLGGGMITDLDGFATSAMNHARRFSWELAWNRMAIRECTLGREAQILGAAALHGREMGIPTH